TRAWTGRGGWARSPRPTATDPSWHRAAANSDADRRAARVPTADRPAAGPADAGAPPRPRGDALVAQPGATSGSLTRPVPPTTRTAAGPYPGSSLTSPISVRWGVDTGCACA